MRTTRTSRSILVSFMALTLLGAACSDSDGASTDEGSDDATSESESGESESAEEVDFNELADTVEMPGQWAVGTTTVDVTGARGRSLPTQVWYPVDTSAAATAEPATYEFPGMEVPSGAVAGVPPADGEFPLVIYSHGSGGLRYVSSFLTEHLASHGFVVMAPDHTGNTALDSFLGTEDETEQVALDRPLDVSAVIDASEAAEPGLEEIAAVTDTEDVAVIGHSFGGYTALVLAGGASGIPADERVDAIVGLAPASSRITDDTLSAVDTPTLLISGTLDETTPIEEDTVRPAEQVVGRPLVRADIDGAGHQSFTDICSYLEIAQTRTDLPPPLVEAIEDYAVDGCAPELIDVAEAQRMTNRLSTAFLLDALYADSAYTALLQEPADEGQPLARLDFAA